MPVEPTGARKRFGGIAPALDDYTDRVLFGDVWERPGLSKRRWRRARAWPRGQASAARAAPLAYHVRLVYGPYACTEPFPHRVVSGAHRPRGLQTPPRECKGDGTGGRTPVH